MCCRGAGVAWRWNESAKFSLRTKTRNREHIRGMLGGNGRSTEKKMPLRVLRVKRHTPYRISSPCQNIKSQVKTTSVADSSGDRVRIRAFKNSTYQEIKER